MPDPKTVTVGPGWLVAMLVGLTCGALGAGVRWSPWVGLLVFGLGFSGLRLALLAVGLLAAALVGLGERR